MRLILPDSVSWQWLEDQARLMVDLLALVKSSNLVKLATEKVARNTTTKATGFRAP